MFRSIRPCIQYIVQNSVLIQIEPFRNRPQSIWSTNYKIV